MVQYAIYVCPAWLLPEELAAQNPAVTQACKWTRPFSPDRGTSSTCRHCSGFPFCSGPHRNSLPWICNRVRAGVLTLFYVTLTLLPSIAFSALIFIFYVSIKKHQKSLAPHTNWFKMPTLDSNTVMILIRVLLLLQWRGSGKHAPNQGESDKAESSVTPAVNDSST